MTDLIEKLNAYCNNLLGEKPSVKPENTLKKSNNNSIKKKKKDKINKKNKNNLENKGSSNLENNVSSRLENKVSSNLKNKVSSKLLNPLPEFTDDGFKIVSQIPIDDELSESDFENLEDSLTDDDQLLHSNQSLKKTDDGFHIISKIPSDDSDISDAFESDLDEEERTRTAEEKVKTKNKKIKEIEKTDDNIKFENSEPNQISSIKKPLLKIIEDFGMQDKLCFNEKSVPYLKKSSTSKLKSKNMLEKGQMKPTLLPDEDIKIVDYSSQRGKRKTEAKKNAADDMSKKSKITKEDAEKSLKQARYEVYKFGLTAFQKQDREKAKIDIAVKLGAKPPKNKSVNYKKLIEERKSQKEMEKMKREDDRHLGLPVKKNVPKNAPRKAGAGNVDPRIGKFKDGILTLSKKDLEKLNKS